MLWMVALSVSLGFVVGAGACGANVDLGGTADAGLPDTSASDRSAVADNDNDDCEPCASAANCAGAACILVSPNGTTQSGNLYCATLCPIGSECDSNETCSAATTSDGTNTRACAPMAGTCPTAVEPSATDGAPLDRCGVLTSPDVPSTCRSCRYDCQPNGCYAGWWCNTEKLRCERPPKNCP